MRKKRIENLDLEQVEPEDLTLPHEPEEKILQNIERMKQNARQGRWMGEGLTEGQFMEAMEREPGLGCLEPGEDYDQIRAKCIRRRKRLDRRMRRRFLRALCLFNLKKRLSETRICRFFSRML